MEHRPLTTRPVSTDADRPRDARLRSSEPQGGPMPRAAASVPLFGYFDTVTLSGALTVLPAAFVNSTV